MQSELGCKVSCYVSFKSDFAQSKNAANPNKTQGPAGFDANASVERSIMTSPRASQTLGKIDADELDFSKWNLGQGKIAEKRVKLGNLVS